MKERVDRAARVGRRRLRMSNSARYARMIRHARPVSTETRDGCQSAVPGCVAQRRTDDTKSGLLTFPWVGERRVHRGSGGRSPASASIATRSARWRAPARHAAGVRRRAVGGLRPRPAVRACAAQARPLRSRQQRRLLTRSRCFAPAQARLQSAGSCTSSSSALAGARLASRRPSAARSSGSSSAGRPGVRVPRPSCARWVARRRTRSRGRSRSPSSTSTGLSRRGRPRGGRDRAR
jgi:hypothetical protein